MGGLGNRHTSVLVNELFEHLGAVPRRRDVSRGSQTAFTASGQSPGVPPDEKISESDEAIANKLEGIDKTIEEGKTTEDEIINSSFGHKVIKLGLPKFDTRNHDEVGPLEFAEMGSKYPGGDVMSQSMWQKWKAVTKQIRGIPAEEDTYAGARLGEYARPVADMEDEEENGSLNEAPVPMSQAQDMLTLVSESGVGSRRARHAAMYAKQTAKQAEEFFRLAQRRARQIFHDPPVTVLPGADVYPFYSAASPAMLAVAGPPSCRGRRRPHASTSALPRRPEARRRSKAFL